MTWRRGRSILLCLLLPAALCGSGALAAEGVEDTAPSEYLSGNGLLNRGLYDLAAAEYRKFLSSHPGHDKAPVARYGLAVCLQRTDQHREAVGELLKLAADQPPDFAYAVEVQILLGQSYVALEEYERAATHFESVVRQHSSHELADDAAAGQADVQYRLQRYDDVIRTARLLQERWPDSPLRERTDYLEIAALVASGAAEQAAGKLEVYLKTHAGGPLAGQARLQLARCRRQLGDGPGAIEAYEQQLEAADVELRRTSHLELAAVLLDEGRAEQARPHVERLLAERDLPEAERLAARFELGRCLLEAGEFEPAQREFRAVVEAKGDRADQAAYLIGKCLLRRGQPAEAARHLAQTRAAFPASSLRASLHYDHAVALLRAENADADPVLESFVTTFPDDPLAGEALRVLASRAHQRQDYAASRAWSRRYIEKFAADPQAGEILFLEGENDYLAGDYRQAVSSYQRYLDSSPSPADARRARFRLGMSHYRLQDFDAAGPLLLEVTRGDKMEGGFATALLALGDIYFQRELWAEAEKTLNSYLQRGETAAADDCLIKIGLACQRQRRFEPAMQALQRLIDDFADSPHVPQAIFEQGQILVETGQGAPARERFERILRDAPSSRFAPHAMRHLASLAMQRGEPQEAAKLLQGVERSGDAAQRDEAHFQRGQALLAGGDFEGAAEAFASFAAAHPGDARAAEARARQAIALSRLQRWDQALKLIGQAEAADLDTELAASLAYEKAWCLRRTGHEQDAAEAYRKLLEQDGGGGRLGPHALLELAELEAKADRHSSAAELLRGILKDAPASSDAPQGRLREQALYLLGVCEFQQDRHSQAADLLEQFIREFPDSEQIASALYFAGEARFLTRQFGPAAPHYQRLAADHRTDPARESALLRLGECLAELQRFEDSAKAYASYLKDYPDAAHTFQARFGTGWAFENLGRHEQAIEAYRQVVAAHKGVTAARAQFQIGECLFAQDRHQDAVTEFLKVDILYAYPEWSAAALHEAGRCFEELAQLPQARDQYQQVVQRFAESRWAAAAAKRLEAMPRNTVPGHEAAGAGAGSR
jgi:TolA-binding protein